MKSLAPSLALALVCAPAVAAAADFPPGATLDVEVRIPDGQGDFVRVDELTQREFFNGAHCLCSQENPEDPEFQFALRLTLQGENPGTFDNPLEIWAGGSACDDVNSPTRSEQCTEIGSVTGFNQTAEPTFRLQDMMFPAEGEICAEKQQNITLYFLYDGDDDGVFTDGMGGDRVLTTTLFADNLPPDAPAGLSVAPGEGAISLSWTPPATDELEHVQVLCAFDGEPIFEEAPDIRAEYTTTGELCDVPPPDLGEDLPDTGDPDAGPTDGPDAGTGTILAVELGTIEARDPRFLCGSANASTGNLRIEGLQNDRSYRIIVLAVDRAGNANALDFGNVSPSPVVDFWEDYHDQGGQADGGVCLINSTFGDDHPFTSAMRDFRDDVLARFAVGQWMIRSYYDYVAPLGAVVGDSAVGRALASFVLLPLALFAMITTALGPGGSLVVLALLGVLALRRRRTSGAATAVAALALIIASGAPASAQPGDEPAAEDGADEAADTDDDGPFALPADADDAPSRTVVPASAPPPPPAPAAAPPPSTTDTPTGLPVGRSVRGHDPYWSDFAEPVGALGPAPISWSFAIKVGPYKPRVDDEFSMSPGPFERMYGTNDDVFVAFDLERYFLRPLGLLGVAASIGVTGDTGRAFQIDVDENGNPRYDDMGRPIIARTEAGGLKRSEEETSFRLIPMSLGLVYRFTYLDDRWRIPLVPYGKAALGYNLWWVTAPSGNVAGYRPPDCPEDDDCVDHARGASFGYQLVAGLALRAERIDPAAATSMRAEGIEHAGFFAEIVLNQADHFGANDRLNVGDLTWVGGVNFEF